MTCVVPRTLLYSIKYSSYLRENGDLVNKFLKYFASGYSLLHTIQATMAVNPEIEMKLTRTGAGTSVLSVVHSGGPYRFKAVLFLLFAISLATAGSHGAVTYEPTTITPPKPQREFRGAWVATVKNIDWPSKPGLSTSEQKAELLAILERAARLKLNAIIFQVRSICDALYASPIEPWSPYLTGTMGKPPQPFYDPLTFAIAEAHKRGLELHAWFNPYRALLKGAGNQPSAKHVSNSRPELVRDYGSYLWLDPGEKKVQDYSLSVVMDVVKRYDVDGVHFDDYFYPYPEKERSGRYLEFPDAASWKKFGAGGKLNRDDWRRENVNAFIERVYNSIKEVKPWVKFGISPFGIWRPGNPRQIQGMDSYEQLYGDSRKWLVNGWVDYLAPQLYWRIDPPQQSFPVLLSWWVEQNQRGRLLFAGLNTAKTAGDTASWPNEEILKQIEITRRYPGISGHIHWNLHSLLQNQLLDARLTKGLYAEPALIPPAEWLDSKKPARPSLHATTRTGGKVRAAWKPAEGEKAWLWLLQVRRDKQWTNEVLPGDIQGYDFPGDAPEVIALSVVDRVGNTSSAATLAARK